MSSLEKCIVRHSALFSVGLFVLLLLSCMSYLYILEIKSSLVSSFATISSHSIGYLFGVFFMVFFFGQKLVSLIRSHDLFLFYFYCLGSLT